MDKGNSPDKKKKELSDYAKYSSLAFQMIATILICVFGGRMLDKWLEFKTPIFTMILALFGVFAAIYVPLRELLKKK